MAPTQDFKKIDDGSSKEPQNVGEGSSLRMVPYDAIKNEFLCAICLSILKKTVTSQECLHRFCQQCIRTSLQVGNQECPTCRAKLTELNLRADPVFDNLIEKLFPQTENPADTDTKHIPAETQKNYVKCAGVSKHIAPIEKPQNGSEDLEITVTQSSKSGSGKRKKTKGKKGSRARKVLKVKESPKDEESNSCNIEQPSSDNTKIGQREVALKTELNKKGAKNITQNFKRSSVPTRRSLRLETLKLECDKNENEIEYNRRLSNGSSEVFFSSLQLRPRNPKNTDDCYCVYKEVHYLGKEKLEDNNDKQIEHYEKQEVPTITEAAAKAETKEKHDLFGSESESTQNNLIVIITSIKNIVGDDKKQDCKETLNKRLKSESSAVSFNKLHDINSSDNNDFLKQTDPSKNLAPKISNKKENHKKVVLPVRRSQRSTVRSQESTTKSKILKKSVLIKKNNLKNVIARKPEAI